MAKRLLSSSLQNGSVSAPLAPLLNSSSFVVLSYPPPPSVSFPSSSSPHLLPLLHLILPIAPLRPVLSLPPPTSFTLIHAPRHLPTLLLSPRILSLLHHPLFSLPLLLPLLHHATSHVPLLPPPPAAYFASVAELHVAHMVRRRLQVCLACMGTRANKSEQ